MGPLVVGSVSFLAPGRRPCRVDPFFCVTARNKDACFPETREEELDGGAGGGLNVLPPVARYKVAGGQMDPLFGCGGAVLPSKPPAGFSVGGEGVLCRRGRGVGPGWRGGRAGGRMLSALPGSPARLSAPRPGRVGRVEGEGPGRVRGRGGRGLDALPARGPRCRPSSGAGALGVRRLLRPWDPESPPVAEGGLGRSCGPRITPDA